MSSTPRNTCSGIGWMQDEPCGRGVKRYDPTGPIFISYRQSDGTKLAEQLDRFLRAGGLVPWRDLVDLPPGETTRRVRQAFAEGISAAVLLVTPEIGKSQFVRDEELPELLALEQEPHDFSFLVLNTIPKTDEKASGDGRSRGDGVEADHLLCGCAQSKNAINVQAPDCLLGTTGQPLKKLKQYGLAELRQLYRDLLYRRLGHLMRPTERYLPVGLPTGAVEAISSINRWLFGDPCIGDGEITIQTQTRPVPDAHTRRSGTTYLGREHDLAIRLRQDPTTGIPAVEDYQYLKETLPIMVDALYAHGVSGVRLTGGGHFSLGWALGAALPVTRQGGLHVIDLDGCEWTDTNSDGDQETFHAVPVPRDVPKDVQQDFDPPRSVAVLIRNSTEQNMQIFEELKAACDESFQIVIESCSGEHHYPANEGSRLAQEIARELRKRGAGKELHIAWSAATSLAPLVARKTNTLNCVLYELTQNPSATRQRYKKVLRVVAGMPDGPIVEVFDDCDLLSEPPACEPTKTLVNLTPHVVRLYRDGVVVKEWPAPDGDQWVRVGEKRCSAPTVHHDDLEIPVTVITSGDLVGEPPEVPGVGYIVPRLSAQASGRRDFYFPFDEVRDEEGNILGARGLGQFPPKSGG